MARTKSTAAAQETTEEKKEYTFGAAPAELQNDYQTRMKVARFAKVSYEQFKKDMLECGLRLPEPEMKAAYDAIKLPVRATRGSAGYDFFSPIPFSISNLNAAPRGFTFPTGVRCEMNEAYCLMIIPKSGLGIKQYSRLGNVVGLIDADFYWADNEGDIMVNIRSDIPGNPPVRINAGQAVCQGVFVPFGVTDDDNATESRHGGLGSTGV